MADTTNRGLYRFGGMWGAAYTSTGTLLSEVVEVSGTIEIGRIDMPLVGTSKGGFKPGRETREGTLRLQKVDTKWEWEVYRYLSQNIQEQRANRDSAVPNLRPFNIQIEYDDPNALGIEKWQLNGCLIWRLTLGFAITDDVVEREYPLTWESEQPIYGFRADEKTVGGVTTVTPSWYTSAPTPETNTGTTHAASGIPH